MRVEAWQGEHREPPHHPAGRRLEQPRQMAAYPTNHQPPHNTILRLFVTISYKLRIPQYNLPF